MPSSDIRLSIQSRAEALNGEQRRAADWMLRQIQAMPLHTLRDAARLAGVPPQVMSQLARQLGYSDFDLLREHSGAAPSRFAANDSRDGPDARTTAPTPQKRR